MSSVTVTEADINLLLATAAMLRNSYLGGNGELVGATDEYAQADRFDDLAQLLAPLCVPPLAEFEQECSDCVEGIKWGHACNSCRGTALWPPTRDGVRLRLLARAP